MLLHEIEAKLTAMKWRGWIEEINLACRNVGCSLRVDLVFNFESKKLKKSRRDKNCLNFSVRILAIAMRNLFLGCNALQISKIVRETAKYFSILSRYFVYFEDFTLYRAIYYQISRCTWTFWRHTDSETLTDRYFLQLFNIQNISCHIKISQKRYRQQYIPDRILKSKSFNF